MSLRVKYAILKATTIVLGALSIPWGTFIGFSFGEGRYTTAVVALCAQTLVALADGYIWFWVLENMKSRTETETNREYGKGASQIPLQTLPSGQASLDSHNRS